MPGSGFALPFCHQAWPAAIHQMVIQHIRRPLRTYADSALTIPKHTDSRNTTTTNSPPRIAACVNSCVLFTLSPQLPARSNSETKFQYTNDDLERNAQQHKHKGSFGCLTHHRCQKLILSVNLYFFMPTCPL